MLHASGGNGPDNRLLADDATIASLLSLPCLGVCAPTTRRTWQRGAGRSVAPTHPSCKP